MHLINGVDKVGAVAPPEFLSQPEASIQVDEGEDIELQCEVGPASDPNLAVNWYRDGNLLSSGSRFACEYDRGYVSLTVMYCTVHDSGTYICLVSNASGQVQSNPCQVTVVPEDGGLDFAATKQQIDAQTGAVLQMSADDGPKGPQGPPQFQSALLGGSEINQGEPIRLETIVGPGADASLSVEWYKDGRLVGTGSRFNAQFDRGYCVLDISYAFPEDSGIYMCLATNKHGQAQSQAAEVVCHPEAGVVTKSLLQKETIDQLMKLDNFDGYVEDVSNEEVDEPGPPVFDVTPNDAAASEGGPAKFLVRIGGFPKPQVNWFINREHVTPDSIINTYSDGAINYLEISRCGEPGEYEVVVQASNAHGDMQAQAKLIVTPAGLPPAHLKHVKANRISAQNKKMKTLKKVDCTDELVHALNKPKPTAQAVMELDRNAEKKAQHAKTEDIAATEKLYDDVASKLRKSGAGSRRGSGAGPGKASHTVHMQQPSNPQEGGDQSAAFAVQI